MVINKEGHVRLSLGQIIGCIVFLVGIIGGWWDIRWRVTNTETAIAEMRKESAANHAYTRAEINDMVKTGDYIHSSLNARLNALERRRIKVPDQYVQPSVYGQLNHNIR